MGELFTSNIQDNEIIKKNDINDSFDAQITNIAAALKTIFENRNDFIVADDNLVKIHSENENDWSLIINPLFAIAKDSDIPVIESETNSFSIQNADDFDRIDTVEICADYEKYDIEQRAFIDFETKDKSVNAVYTKRRLVLKTNVLKNSETNMVAPIHTAGWIKIAEIFVPANATKIADCTINNITADIYGQENDDWTSEKSSTFNLHFISDINRKFRIAHNADGSHKDKIFGASNILIGTDTNEINGNILPLGNSTIVSGSGIESTNTLFEAVNILAGKINDIYNLYLANGKYKFANEVEIGGDANNTYTGDRLKLGFNQDGSAYLKLGDKNILSILADGKLRVRTDFTSVEKNDLIDKAYADDIQDDLDAQKTRIKALEDTNDKTIFINDSFSRYSIDGTTITVATSGTNITLKGLQTIDGVYCPADTIILVKDQDNAKENGLYKVASGSWSRKTSHATPASLINKLFEVQNGNSNKGKIFYISNETFINSTAFGSDDIKLNEYFGSIKPVAYKNAVRNSSGNLQTGSASNDADCVNKSDVVSGAIKSAILDYVYPIGSIYMSTNNTNPGTRFGGTWQQIKDRVILAAGDSYSAGDTGGASTVTLGDTNLPAHTHSITHSHSGTCDFDLTVKLPEIKDQTTEDTTPTIEVKDADSVNTGDTEFGNDPSISLSGDTNDTDLYCRLNSGIDETDLSGTVTFIPMNFDQKFIESTGGITIDQNGTSKTYGFDRFNLGSQRIKRRLNFNFKHKHSNPTYDISTESGSTKGPGHKHSITLETSSSKKTGKHNHKITFSVETGKHNHEFSVPETDCTVTTNNKTCTTTSQNTESSGSTGTSTPFSVMNPYLVAYVWKRTN